MNQQVGQHVASCRCGTVQLEVTGAPILSVDCHCDSCQTASAGFGNLPGAPQVVNALGGTPFILQRKDRVRFARGAEALAEHRLRPEAKTRRMLASCCDSPMFLEFSGGHWLSIYRDRLPDGAAPLEMRVMTGNRPGAALPDDVPNYKTHSFKFMWRLFTAWAAMGFRVPKMPV